METINQIEQIQKMAKEKERSYNWIEASNYYRNASNLIEDNFEEDAELYKKIGHCYFRASLQAKTNKQFRSIMNKSVQAFRKTVGLFKKCSNEKLIPKIRDAKAMVAYSLSWLELDASKKIQLLDEWWSGKNKALIEFRETGDLNAVARICSDMIEGSVDCRFWLGSNWKEVMRNKEELICLGERAIEILSETNDIYQIARAYCWTSWACLVNPNNLVVATDILDKGLFYSKKALDYSIKVNDAWLIGWSYISLGNGELAKGNTISAINYYKKTIHQAEVAKDNYILGVGKFLACMLTFASSLTFEDPEKNRKLHKQNLKTAEEVINHFEIANQSIWNAYYLAGLAFLGLALIQPNIKTKYGLLKKAVEYARKGVQQTEAWTHTAVPTILNCLSWALFQLSEVERNPERKKVLLYEALNNTERSTEILKLYPQNIYFQIYNQNWIALIKARLSNITESRKKKTSLLTDTITSIELAIKLIKIDINESKLEWRFSRYGDFSYYFAEIFYQLYLLTKKKKFLSNANQILEFAIDLYNKAQLITKIAESYWQKAKILDKMDEHLIAAEDYELSSNAYLEAAQKIHQLKKFYENHAYYMQAWSQIEQARYYHSIENYEKAKEFYENCTKLHEKSESWSYLSSNYFAWAKMEEAEGLSRTEKTELAKQKFQKAYEQFCNVEESIKQKIEEITALDEKDMAQKLLQASDLRRKYCQARVLMEEAKILDREGKHLDSSKKYGQASKKISMIINEIDEVEKKELEYIATLCQAWEKMANAEETTSAEAYLEAGVLFEKAKEYCYTKRASLWALGNSNFCRGLAAGVKYQTSLDLEEHAKAKSFMKSASNNYLKAGFKAASEYAKATQRLFDAYAFMNRAEKELDQEKRAKQYQMAENLLQIAAGSFMKSKQPEKTTQVQEILTNVREEKTLAISLSQVMKAPVIASTTQSFTAPTQTSEVSVGLESFEHANVQANLVTHVKKVKIGESFCLSVEFVNAGREPALLMRVEDFIPSGFVVVKKPEIYRIEETTLNMKGKQLAPLKLVEVKLTLQPSKKGEYQLNPKVHYLDEVGQSKSLKLKMLELKVEEVIMEDRVKTGTEELDSLLLGGIPGEYAVVLTGSPSDEREYIIRNFLEAGIKSNETVFYVATEADGLENLLDNSNFILFLCNPKPKTKVPDLQNVYKLRSKTDLTNLSISLAKAFRNIDPSKKKRICVETVSDVLLEYGAKATRKWVSELITDLGSKEFTMLVVINPLMHSSEDLHAILDLFDGELELAQTGDPLECKKSIRVKKLRNQDYIKNPICLINKLSVILKKREFAGRY